MNNDVSYCPFCGAQVEQNAKFCPICGAALKDLDTPTATTQEIEETTPKVKILQESPIAESSFEAHATPTQTTYKYTPPATMTSYSSPSVAAAQPKPVEKDNAIIALVLGIVTLFVNCFILPIIGLVFVNKAEKNNEDPQLVRAAKIVNWIMLVLFGISFIAMIGYLIWYAMLW